MTQTLSYEFAAFSSSDRQAELGRLRAQATVLWAPELELLRRAGLRSGSAVAEIGCGPGFVAGGLAAAASPGQVTGVDLCAELLDVARAVVQPEHENLRFLNGSAYATDLPSASFDFVYNRMLYQHLDSPGTALAEARRILRPGGRICVVDVDDAWLTLYPSCPAFERLTAAAQQAQAERGGDRYIGRKLPALLHEAGFRDVSVEVVAVTSLELGMTAFLDLTTRFKAVQAGALGAELVDEVYRFANSRDAYGAAAVFAVSAGV